MGKNNNNCIVLKVDDETKSKMMAFYIGFFCTFVTNID